MANSNVAEVPLSSKWVLKLADRQKSNGLYSPLITITILSTKFRLKLDDDCEKGAF